jgi:thiol-disulfide isomerase/thioredoxin
MRSASSLVVLAAACATAAPAPAPSGGGSSLPPFTVERWVNSPPLTPAGLRGKVVLVDFWEYTCVNCIRTLPFVKAWWATYGKSGLVVVGVHAPEFDFGKRAENIDRGIRDHGLTYPIAIDNDFDTWNAYHNQAWPAKYLFDATGKLRNVWLGEGGYDAIEDKIRALLVEAGATALPEKTAEVRDWKQPPRVELTPETYLGTARREGRSVARVGAWDSAPEYIEHADDAPAKLVLDFRGGEVNLVLQPGRGGKATVALTLDGKPAGKVCFDRPGMVPLVKGAGPGPHKLEIETENEGLRAFAFTFGP